MTELAQQMQDWVKASAEDQNQSSKQPAKPIVNNYTRAKGAGFLSKNAAQEERMRSKSRGRRSDSRSKHNKDVTPITRSLSPESKMRKRGQDFVNEIEKLKQDLAVQGQAFELI